MKNTTAALYGVGAVGSLIAKLLLEKKSADIVGAIDVAKDKVDKDLGEILGLDRTLGIRVTDSVDSLLRDSKPDIVIHATSSFLRETYPQLASIVKHGTNVVSTCEELTYPYLTEPRLSKKLDMLAREHDATVLGTGINPGFLMDTLVIALSSACLRIEKIEATRVINAATRRLPFQKKIGAGLTVEEFLQCIKENLITGHVGLLQSIAMIADALAWKLDKVVSEPVEPVKAEKLAESGELKVKAGNVAGLRQKAIGLIKGRNVIVLDFQAYVGAEDEYDSIAITGVPNIRQKIQPCVHGDTGTIAVVTNAIPKVISARPGLLTMKDLPIPSATWTYFR